MNEIIERKIKAIDLLIEAYRAGRLGATREIVVAGQSRVECRYRNGDKTCAVGLFLTEKGAAWADSRNHNTGASVDKFYTKKKCWRKEFFEVFTVDELLCLQGMHDSEFIGDCIRDSKFDVYLENFKTSLLLKGTQA
jgi:hypothetical protein